MMTEDANVIAIPLRNRKQCDCIYGIISNILKTPRKVCKQMAFRGFLYIVNRFLRALRLRCIAMYIALCIAIMLDAGVKKLYLCIVFRKDTVIRQ